MIHYKLFIFKDKVKQLQKSFTDYNYFNGVAKAVLNECQHAALEKINIVKLNVVKYFGTKSYTGTCEAIIMNDLDNKYKFIYSGSIGSRFLSVTVVTEIDGGSKHSRVWLPASEDNF